MRVGAFAVLFSELPLGDALDRISEAGCGAVELGCGGYPGNVHCDPHRLLEDASALSEFRNTVKDSGLEISALSCHGNPLHPDARIADAHDRDFQATVRLAERLGVETVITFSGCPGDSEGSKKPNWVTCPWPPDFQEILEWQWIEKVAPYWEEAADFAGERGVRVAIEPHPGFVVYNTDSFRRLREIGGETVGLNFDPSHLFWQQMDPLVCVRELGPHIFHAHAKDTHINRSNTEITGVLDTKDYSRDSERSWGFRTVGDGHGPDFWQTLIDELRRAGYDGAVSIEHEDPLVGAEEGLTRAAALLGDAIESERI